MKSKKSLFIAVGLMVTMAMGIFTGCSSQKQGEKDGDQLTMRIANFPNITHSQALVGATEGQFQKALGENTTIEWKTFNAGPAEIEAFFAGEIDLGYIGPGPAINGYIKSNGDLQIIAGATEAGAILVSRQDVKIKGLKDLSGKKIAVPQFGNTQHLSLLNLLQENGLKETTKGGTVEVIQADNPDIKTLLDSGEIDAAFVPEPWGSRLVKEVNANVVLDYDQVWKNGEYSTAVVVARTEFIEEHPDVVENFLKAHVELTDYINNNPDQAKATVNAKIKELTQKELPADVLDAAFDRLKVTYDPRTESVVGFANLSYEAGFLKEKPNVDQLFNLELLNKVLKEQGKPEIQ
ncbi:aliphatic sulfonate ABC transporter substrate-binding protein [Clostridium aminobutyricum]|uniref:Aliphatic sulfonate ABC transporter substrate-binding protein n=1 Tax=Clostridium aminobutyricum TaxID=33953 RepID=A0A939D856_CLOAM|nr:aliphatic sulfonate ABC transporter substrate-binding protein [Clostridium aminobutyricum]MBN7772488.1 aliphatic sulfonate ABC transporter substrate-binding protein [Clostridium aminobutyricum]